MKPVINLAVCGRFHYENAFPYVAHSRLKYSLYYSHRFTMNRVFGGRRVNVAFKEYAIALLSRSIGPGRLGPFLPLLHGAWQLGVLGSWQACSLLQFLLHGNCLSLLARAKDDGAVILAEAVNTHPAHFDEIMRRENLAFGLLGESPRKRSAAIFREIALADHILVPSGNVLTSFLNHGVTRDRLHLIPFSVNSDIFYLAPDQDPRNYRSKLKVLCVAQVSLRKGFQYLMPAWHGIRGVGELRVAGIMDHRMVPLLARYKDDFTFLGPLPRASVAHEMKNAHVFVLASIEEGFAYVIQEAMAAGCVVIATEESGAGDVIVSGFNGILVKARDSRSLSAAITQVAEDRVFLESLSRNARHSIHSAGGWRRYGEKLSILHEELLQSASSNRRIF
jgi:glycosyltransferase involved in cell wall biosynthesis